MVAAGAEQRRAVICLGDSHTRGFYGGSWLKLLRAQFPHLRFVNAGNDGEPSASIAARLPALLQAYPNPAAVTIFSGSNDCIAQGSWQLGEYYRRKFGVSQCSEQQALDNLEDMLQLVHKEAPNAKVICHKIVQLCAHVCTMPLREPHTAARGPTRPVHTAWHSTTLWASPVVHKTTPPRAF